jgi:hypothetical protein
MMSLIRRLFCSENMVPLPSMGGGQSEGLGLINILECFAQMKPIAYCEGGRAPEVRGKANLSTEPTPKL